MVRAVLSAKIKKGQAQIQTEGKNAAGSKLTSELQRQAKRLEAHTRRWHGPWLDRDPALRDQVLAGLKVEWSPEQVPGIWSWRRTWAEKATGRPAQLNRFVL